MRRRHITEEQIAKRKQLLQAISSQAPLGDKAREMLSPDGFYALFLELKPLYPNNIEAYEALEEQYQRIFHTRKYSEYYSFRTSIMQKNKKTAL